MEYFCGTIVILGALVVPIVLSIIALQRTSRIEGEVRELRELLRQKLDALRQPATENATAAIVSDAPIVSEMVPPPTTRPDELVPEPVPEVPTLGTAYAPSTARSASEPPLPEEAPSPGLSSMSEAISPKSAVASEAAAPEPAAVPGPASSPEATPTPEPPIDTLPPPPPPLRPSAWSRFDWEALVGVKLFSWVAGVAMVIAAIYFLRYSAEHGWISPPVRAAIGLLAGSALLVVCEMRVARGYRITANAMHGAGIAILYATFFAIHALWHLLPAGVVFAGMLVVTAVAVGLSLRRESLFIALLGMMGGFATPALLSTGENRPIGLFSYLLLLNVGLAWVAYRKRWPALTFGSVVFSVIYQWAWIAKFLDAAQLPLAAGIFLLFAIAAASALWIGRRDDSRQTVFDRVGQLAAALPLVFALFTAAVPAYGARYNILFGFLLLIAGGLAAISLLRKIEWLHALSVLATLLTFAIWLAVSYTPEAWPAILAWLAAFVVLQLGVAWRNESRLVVAAGVLFFVFPALLQLEPQTSEPLLLFGVLLALLACTAAYAIRFEDGWVYYVAAFFAILSEAMWSAKHLDADLLYFGLTIYAVFGLMFLAVPALARRFGRTLRPTSGISATVIAGLVMLLFLTSDGVAAAALWGLAILLAVLLIGAMAQARSTGRPLLATVAVILSWIVLASWWESAPLERALIPALAVIAIFGVVVVLAGVWGARKATSDAFSNQAFLALAGHGFLIFVAASPALALPPWPLLAVLALLDLAIGVGALYVRRGSLLIGSVVMSQIVLLVWTANATDAPWPNVALAATLSVAAYAVIWSILAERQGLDASAFRRAAILSLFLGHLVAIGASQSSSTPLFATLLATHAVLAIATLVFAAVGEVHILAVVSVAFTALGISFARADTPVRELALAGAMYAIYIAYPLVLGKRVKRAFEPYLAAVLASIPLFFFARDAMIDAGYRGVIGVLPVAQALVMLVLLAQLLRIEPPTERLLSRLALIAATALAFITVAVPLQLDKQWITIGWALEGAALVWLFRRIPHRGLLAWSAALLVAVFVRLTINPAVLSYHGASATPIFNWYLYTYLVCAAAFFAAARLAPRDYGKAIAACRAAATILLFFLVNIEIADYYSTGATVTFNFFSSSLAQDLTYTIGWALFAIAMLVAGIATKTRAARVAAIGLLVVTIFKCFLHDLGRLGGLYRIASFLGLALALVAVSVLLQKFVLSRRTTEEPPA